MNGTKNRQGGKAGRDGTHPFRGVPVVPPQPTRNLKGWKMTDQKALADRLLRQPLIAGEEA